MLRINPLSSLLWQRDIERQLLSRRTLHYFFKFRFFVELFSADTELWRLRKEIQKLSLQLYGSW